MFKSSSITIKIAVPIILIVFLVLTTLSSFMLKNAWEKSKLSAYEKSLGMGQAAANGMQLDIELSLSVSKSIGDTLLSKKNNKVLNRDVIANYTSDILKRNPHLIGTWAIFEPNEWDGEDQKYMGKGSYHDKTGRLIPYSAIDKGNVVLGPLLEYDVPGPGDYYLIPKQRLKQTMIEPYLYKIGDETVMMTSAVVPIFLNEKMIGATGVDLALKSVQAKVNAIRPFETSSSYLISSGGNYVSHPDVAMITKRSGLFTDDRFKDSFQKNIPVSVVLEENSDEFLYTAIPFTFGTTDQTWTLVIKTPMDTILSGAKKMLWIQMGISLLGLLLLLSAIFVIAKRLTTSLNEIISGLKHESEIVTSNSRAVAQASERISSANTQQASSLQETVSSIEEISAMVSRNADNANDSAQRAEQSTQAVLRGKEISKQVLESIKSIEMSNEEMIAQMELGNKEMASIVSDIQNISAKTQVINDIVFQTKLLSFNASVEAARAGENGKGFAVVAEEVGNLASMSGKAAQEIFELVEGSVKHVTEVADRSKTLMQKVMANSKAKLESGIATSHECDRVLEEIMKNVSIVDELIRGISTASHEQAAGIREINKAMTELDQATQSSMVVANETSTTASELMSQADRLNDLVTELNTLTSGAKAA